MKFRLVYVFYFIVLMMPLTSWAHPLPVFRTTLPNGLKVIFPPSWDSSTTTSVPLSGVPMWINTHGFIASWMRGDVLVVKQKQPESPHSDLRYWSLSTHNSLVYKSYNVASGRQIYEGFCTYGSARYESWSAWNWDKNGKISWSEPRRGTQPFSYSVYDKFIGKNRVHVK